MLHGSCDKGVVVCGTGIGVSITANKVDGIRCSLCHDVFSAKATRQHNDSNMLAMGQRVIGEGLSFRNLYMHGLKANMKAEDMMQEFKK